MISSIRHDIALTAAFLAAVVVVAPAWAQRDRLSLAERVDRLEAELGSDENRQTLTDLVLRLNQMEQEIRDLRGLVEDQTFEVDNLKSSQRDLYLDLDRRLTEGGAGGYSGATGNQSPSGFPLDTRSSQGDESYLDEAAVSGFPSSTDVNTRRRPSQNRAGATSQAVSGNGVDRAGAVPLQGEVPEVREAIDAGLESTGLTQTGPGNVAALADPVAEKSAYNVAFEALKNGRYAEAARLFSLFLDRFPAGDYADNAQYWLGESYYVTGNYRIALESFQDLLSRFPSSAKAPDARLKLGYTYFSLKEWPDAERVLKDVIAQYPNSTVSRLAENRLRTMRIQGHIQ